MTTLFITPHVHYGAGLEAVLPHLRIVTLFPDPIVSLLRKAGVPVFVLAEATPLPPETPAHTPTLLSHPETQAYLSACPKDSVAIVFKSTAQTEMYLKALNIPFLGADAGLARRLENKIHFANLLEQLDLPRLPQCLETLHDKSDFDALAQKFGLPFVLQTAFGFGGSSTHLISNRLDWEGAIGKNRGKQAKISKYLNGETITINACVAESKNGGISVGTPFRQLTGIECLTMRRLGACGNDWSFRPSLRIEEKIYKSVQILGNALLHLGFRGFFGIDFLLDDAENLYFIEINPRFTASLPMYTALEHQAGQIPLLYRHIAAFCDLPLLPTQSIDPHFTWNGGQMILHNIEGVSCRLTNVLTPGLYRHDLTFLRSCYQIFPEMDESECLILPRASDTQLKPDAECARILTKHPLTAPAGSLLPSMKNLAERAYQRLGLHPV